MRKINIVDVWSNSDGTSMLLQKRVDKTLLDVKLDSDVIEFIVDECHIELTDLLNIINTLKVTDECTEHSYNDVNKLDGWLYNDIDE